MTNKKIILIGGGELSNYDTLEIDKRIVEISEKANPSLLFIPTASFDAEGYIESVAHIYGKELGCKVSALRLTDETVTREEASRSILSADIIYVGGGSTKNLMYHFNRLSLAPVLREAWERGIVLSGISAGSICWFEYGHSDSITYETGTNSPYILMEGLGLIRGLHCPHYNDNRQSDFRDMVLREKMVGIALEDFTALEIINESYKVLKTRDTAKVYKIWTTSGQLFENEVNNTESYISLNELTTY